MRNIIRALMYITPLALLAGAPISTSLAQETAVVAEAEESETLNQAELDQMLAPIALYPDTLLSHILVASTYPLEVIQAARWRKDNDDLNEQQILDAAESTDWDPSVQALTPFADLLDKLSEDLSWLQDLGDAFLANETQVLATVQNLRHKAYQQGTLTNNGYIEVEKEQDEIVIETVQKEVVYVPYYDTRVVYGNWWWDAYPPLYWHTPVHYTSYAGFYWGPRVIIRPNFYFGGFHWHRRQLVVNYDYRRHPHRYDGHQRVRVKEYQRWHHDKKHRRNARYLNPKVVRSIEHSNKRVLNSQHKVTGPRQVESKRPRDIAKARSVQHQLKQRREHKVKRETPKVIKSRERQVQQPKARNWKRNVAPTHKVDSPRVKHLKSARQQLENNSRSSNQQPRLQQSERKTQTFIKSPRAKPVVNRNIRSPKPQRAKSHHVPRPRKTRPAPSVRRSQSKSVDRH